MRQRFGPLLCLTAALAGCGGGGGGGDAPPPPVTVTPPPVTVTPPPPPTATCSLRARQDWALARMQEFHLFPNLLQTNVDPARFTNINDYIDEVTAEARRQNIDRFFTYMTSIAEENAFLRSGATAGFGIRFALNGDPVRLFVTEAIEGAPGLAAGLDRGSEILAIGTSANDLRTIPTIWGAGGQAGSDALSAALGPNTAGTQRTFRIRSQAGVETVVSITKAEFNTPPVSNRYGAQIINDGGRRVGYIHLRTFIESADAALRQAFARFRAEGITEVIVDVRYNGGGLVSTAELFSNLLSGQRLSTDVLSRTTHNAQQASRNRNTFFTPQPESIAATKIAFIGTRASASASELIMNAAIPYLGANAALIGSNTFGKPVGQFGLDRAECDDRLRVVAFRTENRDGQGDYYNGLATVMRATCRASDDVTRQLGDPQEASTRAALDFLAGRTCTPIGAVTTQQAAADRKILVQPSRPTTAQREMPGFF